MINKEVKKTITKASVVLAFVLFVAIAVSLFAVLKTQSKADTMNSVSSESVTKNAGQQYDAPIIEVKSGVGILVKGGNNYGSSFAISACDSGRYYTQTYNYTNGEYFISAHEIAGIMCEMADMYNLGYGVEEGFSFYNIGEGAYSNSIERFGVDTYYNLYNMHGYVGYGLSLNGSNLTISAPNSYDNSYDCYFQLNYYNYNYSGGSNNFTWTNSPYGDKINITSDSKYGFLRDCYGLSGSETQTFDLNTLGLPNGRYVISVVGDRNFMIDQKFVIVDIGIPVSLPEPPYKNGYDFVGWYFDSALTQPYDNRPIYADTDLFAKFTPINYTITYNNNGGTLTGQKTSYTIETNTFTLATPTKTGYTFGGWFTNSNFTGTAVTQIAKGSTDNKTYYAKWNVVPYTITYNTNGGELTGQATGYNIESADITLVTPTKTGYEFKGWYDNASFTGFAITKIAKGSTGNKTFYAKFDVINYNINYHVDNGDIINPVTSYTVDTPTFTLATPSKTGYDFIGWYDNADFSGLQISSVLQGSTGNKNYYAKFEIQTFVVTFYVDGIEYMSMVVEYGTQLVNLFLVDLSTMQAVSFSTDLFLQNGFDINELIVEDLQLFTNTNFAVYAGLTYDIEGERVTDLLDYNSRLDNLRTAEKEGYIFEGWYYDDTFTHEVKSTDKIVANTIIFAKFSVIEDEDNKINAFLEHLSNWKWVYIGAVALAVVIVFIAVKKRVR